MRELIDALVEAARQIISAIPSLIYALVILLIGYLVATLARVGVKLLFDKVLWRFLEKTSVGQRLKEAGVDLGGMVGVFVFLFIMVMSIIIVINALKIPNAELIVEFARIIVNVLGGLIIIVIGMPLATLGAEYLTKLVVLPLKDKSETFQNIVSTALTVIFILFVFGLAMSVMFGVRETLQTLTSALPSGIMAGVIIIIGYVIAEFIGRSVKEVIGHIAKPTEETDVGKALKSAGIELSTFIGGVVKAAIIVLAIAVGLGMIGATGVAGNVLTTVAFYLPRILGAVVLLSLGLALVIVLAKYIGKVFRAIAKEKYEPLALLVENLIALGLIAAFVAIALNILGLMGTMVYALIIGAIVIVMGIIIVDTLTKLLSDVHTTFDRLAPLIGIIIVLVFAYVGVSAILLHIPGAADVLRTVGWGIAIAFAVVLIPVAFHLAKAAMKEATTSR